MTKITISMPDPMGEYVAERVHSGQYGNVSEYFRDLVRRDQSRQPLTEEQLRQRLREAAKSGISDETIPDIVRRIEAKLRSDGRL